jgi:chemotaxis signal transduction protein
MAGGERRVVVWRTGEALLAVPLESTVEIAGVDAGGLAVGRDGPLELAPPPGLALPDGAQRAVVVRTPGGTVALAADSVEGVMVVAGEGAEPVPPWLGRLPVDHIEGVVRTRDGQVAALLDVDALGAR